MMVPRPVTPRPVRAEQLVETAVGPSMPLSPRYMQHLRFDDAASDGGDASDDSSATVRPSSRQRPFVEPSPTALVLAAPTRPRSPPAAAVMPPCCVDSLHSPCVECTINSLRNAVRKDFDLPAEAPEEYNHLLAELPRLEDTLLHYATLRAELTEEAPCADFVARAQAAHSVVHGWEQRRVLHALSQQHSFIIDAIEGALQVAMSPQLAYLVARPICERLANRVSMLLKKDPPDALDHFDLEAWLDEAIARAFHRVPAGRSIQFGGDPTLGGIFDDCRRAAQLRHFFELVHDIDMRALSERLADN